MSEEEAKALAGNPEMLRSCMEYAEAQRAALRKAVQPLVDAGFVSVTTAADGVLIVREVSAQEYAQRERGASGPVRMVQLLAEALEEAQALDEVLRGAVHEGAVKVHSPVGVKVLDAVTVTEAPVIEEPAP